MDMPVDRDIAGLAHFLRRRIGPIVEDWEGEVRRLPAARQLPRLALIDHIPELLLHIADLAEAVAAGRPADLSQEVAERHAFTRLDSSFDLPEVVREFSILRRSVVRQWEREGEAAETAAGRTVLDHALDVAMIASVERYTRARDRTLEALDRVSSAAFEADTLEELLDKLLRVLLDTTEAVDTAAILLREGGDLVRRASVGLEDDGEELRIPIGSGFAGHVAATGAPVLVHAAANDPLVKSQPIRATGVRALYGVPLLDRGTVIGVVHIGSLSTPDFSDQDKRLVRALGSRATAVIVQHMLQAEARAAARRFHELANHLRDVVWIADPDLRTFEYVSPAYERMWGHSIEELRVNPRSFLEDVLPEDRPRVEAMLPRMRDGVSGAEYRVRRPDGTMIWVHARGFPVHDDRGEVVRIVGLTEDITARKQAELERADLLAREREARADAESAHAQIAGILERMTEAFLAVDREWRIVYLNPGGERIIRELATVAGDLQGRVLWDAVPQIVGTPFEHAYRRAMQEQVPVHLEEFLPPINAWFEVRVFPSADGLTLYFRDVTERRRTEDGLRFVAAAGASLSESLEYEETLRRIAELAVPGIADFCVIDLVEDGHEMKRVAAHAAPRFASIIHHARQFPPVIREERLFAVQAFRTGRPQLRTEVTDEWLREHVAIDDAHYAFLRRLGLRSVMALPFVAFGRTSGVMTLAALSGSGRHFTERDLALTAEVATHAALAVENARLYGAARDAEARIRGAERRQRFLAEASRTLAESVEYGHTLAAVARLLAPEIADWCAIDLVQPDGSLARVAVQHRDPSRVQLAEQLRRNYPPRADAESGPARAVRTGRTEFIPHIPDSVLRRLAVDDEHLRILDSLGLRSLICVPLIARGRIIGAITLVTEAGHALTGEDVALAEDLARRAAIAIDNARLFEETQRAVRAREDVLAIVSHDLRNPLGAILVSAASQIRRAPPDEHGRAIRKYAETIQRSAQRMNRLIDDLTDIAQIESGTLTLERTTHDPREIVTEAIEAHQTAAAERGTALRATVAPDVPLIVCDRDRLIQALSNILGNALKVTLGGSVTLEVRADEREVVFAIADTGPGIAPADLPHLFERFWRSQTAPYAGTGLGLAIVKGIVDAHGARCWAESRPGAGSTFFIAVPRPASQP